MKLKSYGTLYNLLDNLLTSKITTSDADADQISFIISLMHGYNKNDLFDERTDIIVKKGKYWKNKTLTKASKIIKKKSKKRNKKFLPKKLLRRYFRRTKKYFNKCNEPIQ